MVFWSYLARALSSVAFSANLVCRLEVRGSSGEILPLGVRDAMILFEVGADYRFQSSGGQFILVRAFQHQKRGEITKRLQARLKPLGVGWNSPSA